jgi:bacterioferritin
MREQKTQEDSSKKAAPETTSPRRTNGNRTAEIAALRRRAREHVENGAITERYGADREEVVRLLNEALATEIVCVLRYKRHYFVAQGLHGKAIASEFLEHALEEQGHADQLCERITQLNGSPDLDPATLLSRSHAEYHSGDTLRDMIREDLIAERIAIESYGEMIAFVGDRDPTTRRLLEEILAKEEEHAQDLSDLLVTHAGKPE